MTSMSREPSTVVEAARLCAKEFLRITSKISLDLRSDSELEDQLGRFKIWAGSLGVFAADTASADYRLRNEHDVKDVLISMLNRLKERLQQLDGSSALATVREEPPENSAAETTTPPHDSSASSSISSSSLSLSSDSDVDPTPTVDPQHCENNRLNEVTDIIDRLYRFSAAIRKPMSTNENERVAKFIQKTKEDLDMKGVESFIRWQIQRWCPNTTIELIDRLTRMAMLRRKTLLYRERHQQKLNEGIQDFFDLNEFQKLEPNHNTKNQGLHSREKLVSVQKKVTFASSVTKASSINRPDGRIYERSIAPSGVTKSAITRRENLDVPPPPKPKHGQEAKCPYCPRFLKQEELTHVRWTRHILKDICPYICLFEACENSDEGFNTVEDWLQHTRLRHTMVWHCPAAGHESELFHSGADLERHMNQQHSGEFSPSQLPFIVDKSRTPDQDTFGALARIRASISESQDVTKLCPLCLFSTDQSSQQIDPSSVRTIDHQKRMSKKLLDHIASHLESIALLSLPERADNDADAADSNEREQTHSRGSHIDQDVENLPPATFTEVLNNDVEPTEDFAEESLPPDVHLMEEGWKYVYESPKIPKITFKPPELDPVLQIQKFLKGRDSGESLWRAYYPEPFLVKTPNEIFKIPWRRITNAHFKDKYKEIRTLLRWLSPVDFRLAQQGIFKHTERGTWRWIFKNPVFLDWKKGNKDTLWCLGEPGVGKTVLTSTIIEFLKHDLPIPRVGLAFIYCNYQEHLVQSIECFLGAIIRQLVELKDLEIIPKEVRTLYKKHRENETKPTYKEYAELLQFLAKGFSEVYIVIDALDECIDKYGRMIWKGLLSELKGSVSNLRLLCTSSSRDIEDIAGILSESTSIEIRASDDDMQTYIQAQIKSKESLLQLCQRDPNLQDKIAQAIISKAQESFLAARLSIEHLATKTSLRAVQRALKELPSTLEESLEKIMKRINQQPQPTKSLALKVLLWIVYAVRPLRLVEVQHAIAIDELDLGYSDNRDRSVTKDDLTPPSRVIDACAGLIRIDKTNDTVSFVHQTIAEYFARNGTIYFPHSHIGITCLKYLSLDIFDDGYCPSDELFERRLNENALLKYAARSLGNHIPEEISDQALKDLASRFFLNERKVSCACQALFVGKSEGYIGYSQKFPKNFHGLHYAAYFGLLDIVKQLLDSGKVEVDSKDSSNRTPLSWAAWKGREAIVKLLASIEGVDPDSKDNLCGQTPLSWAAGKGREAIVKLLASIEGVDPDSKDKYGQTPLSQAAENGREAIVKLLASIEGVDPDSKDNLYGKTPLSWAAENGHEAIVKLLASIEGVDPDSKDNLCGRTPLSWAAENGREAIVKLLASIEGVDPDSKDNLCGRTPLSWAAGKGREAIVKLLASIEGVDPDSKDNLYGKTPLSWAAGNGHEAVVKLLLAIEEVDPDSKDKYDRTPLSCAAENGHEAVVKLLQSRAPSL